MPSIPQTKKCSLCKQEKPYLEFNKNKSRRDGLNNWCKNCRREHDRRYYRKLCSENPEALARLAEKQRKRYAKNPEHFREKSLRERRENPEYNRKWRAEHLEQARETDRKWRAEHAEHVNEVKRRWRTENKEHIACKERAKREENPEYYRAKSRKFYTKNRERIRELARKRYTEDPEREREKHRQRRAKNPECYRAIEQRKRARRRSNGGSYTRTEWETLCAKYNHICLRCGEYKPLTPDHIIPVSKGGTSYISNIQPLCFNCNCRKGTKTTDYRY